MATAGAAQARPLRADDLPALLDLWVDAWRAAYPAIDFEARRDWARARFAQLQQDGARIVVAEAHGAIAGVVTVDPANGYIDQIVVGTRWQRQGIATLLLGAARQVSPDRLELDVNRDNAAAIGLYSAHGFAVTSEGRNTRSGAPTCRMTWRPFVIRDAAADDAEAACDVLRRSIAALCGADHHDDPETLRRWLANKTPENLAAWIGRPDASLLVATERDTIVGVGSVTDEGEIQLNYVAPEARFRGVSRAMLEALERRALARGNARCHLLSTETAHRLYRSAGYRDSGPPQGKFGTASSYPMQKPLSGPGV